MKKLIFALLLTPFIGLSQSNRTVLNTQADSLLTNSAHQNNAKYFNRILKKIILSDFNLTSGDLIPLGSNVSGNLSVSHLNSGTGASSSTFWCGDGTWKAGAGGGITNSGANNEMVKSDGTNVVGTGIYNTSSGNLGLGTSTFIGGATFEVFGTSPVASILKYANTTTAPALVLGANRNTSITGHTAVQNGDGLGDVSFFGDDGTTFFNAADIVAVVNGSVSTGNIPTDVIVKINNVEKFRFNSNGTITIANQNWQSVSSFVNSWSGNTLRYRIDGNGQVFLSGTVTYGGGLSQVTSTGVFPNASSANGSMKFYTLAAGSNNTCTVIIDSTGKLVIGGVSGALSNGDIIALTGFNYSTN